MIRHYKNAAWSVAEGLGYPLLLLAATPLLLKSLGPVGFGLWMLMITITSLGLVIAIGLGPAVIKLIAESTVESTNESTRNAVDVARGAMAVAALAGGVMALLVAGVGVVLAESWLAKLGSPTLVIGTVVFSAVVLWVDQFDSVISSVIKGLEDFGLAARLEICLKLSQISLVIGVAIGTRSLTAVFAVFLGAAVLRLAVKAVFLMRRFPGINLAPQLRSAGPVLNISKWGWVQGVGSVLFLSADRLIIGAALGPISLGYYSIAVQLVSQSHSLIANAFSIVVPRVSRIGLTQGTAALKSMTKKLALANVAVAVLAALAMWLLGPSLLRLWVGPEVASQVSGTLTILAGVYVFLSSGVVPFHVLTGLGAMRTIAIVCIAGGLVTLALNLFLVPIIGLDGAAWARLGYALVSLLLFIPILRSWRKPADASTRGQVADSLRTALSPRAK